MKFVPFGRKRALTASVSLVAALIATSALVAGPASADNPYAEPTPAPKTKITGKPAKRTKDRTATFRFTSNQNGSTFECKVDAAGWKSCRSPLKLKNLRPGRHVLKVRASYAKTDKSPAVFRWTVLKK